jgi:hypothetical protein
MNTYRLLMSFDPLEEDGFNERIIVVKAESPEAAAQKALNRYEMYYDNLQIVSVEDYAMGGSVKYRKKSLEERAEGLVGSSTWHDLGKLQKAEVISELVTEGVLPNMMAEGGITTSEKFSVKYTLADGKIVEVVYNSKNDMDEGIAEFYLANDVENVEVQEQKKKSLFDMAKKTDTPKSKSKAKPEVRVVGIESEIARYDELKEIINNAKAEQEIIGGKLKQIGKEQFLELYEEKGSKPDNFNLADGDEEILFIVMDKYKKVEPEKQAILEQYKGLLEVVTTYSFNPEVLDRVGEVVSNLILESKDLSDDDKNKLIIKDTTVAIKKGTIDRLMDYEDPEQIFDLVEPILALK